MAVGRRDHLESRARQQRFRRGDDALAVLRANVAALKAEEAAEARAADAKADKLERKAERAKGKERKAAEAAHRPAQVEVYPADHGWCVPDSPAYDPVQADRAWQHMLELFAQL